MSRFFKAVLLRCFIVPAFGLLVIGSSNANESAGPSYTIEGWNEVLVSVRDIERYTDFFAQFETWEAIDEGNVSASQLLAWQLPSSAQARYRVYANQGTVRGYIRLVEISGVEQVLMRPDSQSWDTGGIFDINMRARELESMAKDLRAQDWQGRSSVTQFSFGPFVVKEWISQNSDGFAVAFIERIEPELEGWPHFKKLSRTFNSTQIVKDIDAARAFYEKVLGFQLYLEHKGASKEPGENVLGLPHNLADKVERTVFILHPDGTNEGSVELLEFDGVTGRDNSDRTRLPNIGIAALSFPVKGIEHLENHLNAAGIEFVHGVKVIGDKRSMIAKSPEGAWLEFFEALE